jgi:hypothetical protein
MLRLDLPTEERWIDLPLGVRLKVRPLTTALEIAADNRAAHLLAERRQGTAGTGGDGRTHAPEPPVPGDDDVVGGLDPAPAAIAGAAHPASEDVDALLLGLDREFGERVELKVIALGQVLITAWEGVGDADGTAPAELTPANVARLLMLDRIGQAFLTAVRAPLERLAAEGNGSGASPHGTSAAAPDTARGATPRRSARRRSPRPGTAPAPAAAAPTG